MRKERDSVRTYEKRVGKCEKVSASVRKCEKVREGVRKCEEV